MPGLIDCHVHITCRPEVTANFLGLGAGYKALLGAEALKVHLLNGFYHRSGLRRHGCSRLHRQRCEARIGEGNHRRGAPDHFRAYDIRQRRSYGMLPLCSHLTVSPGRTASPTVPDEIRRRVREEIKWGAEWIKFAPSGGFSTPADDPVQVSYTQEEMDNARCYSYAIRSVGGSSSCGERSRQNVGACRRQIC